MILFNIYPILIYGWEQSGYTDDCGFHEHRIVIILLNIPRAHP